MDPNKLQKLKEMGYRLESCCGLCQHYNRTSEAVYFGTCHVSGYRHLKHTGGEREVSVCRYGSCSEFAYNEGMSSYLHAFVPFLEKK